MLKQILNHPGLNHASDIYEICKPLTKLGISYFAHVQIDNNDNFTGICNNPQFLEHYLKNQYFNADIHMAKENKFGNYVLWDAINCYGESDKLDLESMAFGIFHTFTIIENDQKYRNYYHFSTKIDNKSINQVYLNNLDILKIFISYFKDCMNKSKKLSKTYDLKFNIDNEDAAFLFHEENLFIHNDIRTELMNELGKSKSIMIDQSLPITHRINKLKLSDREKECLLSFVSGRTISQTAEILQLSNRTVDTYLENIKWKLNVRKKSELIEKIIGKL